MVEVTSYVSTSSVNGRVLCFMQSRARTVFSVEPPSGVINPQETLELIVTAAIDDCLRYKRNPGHVTPGDFFGGLQCRFTDKVTVVVSKGVNITISLSAEGEGTTIVSQPPLQPKGFATITMCACGSRETVFSSIPPQWTWVPTFATRGHVGRNSL